MTPTLLLFACTQGTLVLGDDTGAPVDTDLDDTDPVDTDDTDDTDDGTEVIPGDTSDTDDTDTTDVDDDAIYEAFFDPFVIQTVDITLDDRAIRALNNNGDAYVVGDVVINGVAFDNVGVRLKGSSTYMDLNCGDGYCKAGFKIKLNEYVVDQRYGDLERITLNNMSSDYTQSKEVIVYEILRQHSQLASRCSYARVTLNGESWGLYANLESADERWLRRRFEDDSGNFWGTGPSYGDFYGPYLDTGWVSKSGDGNKAQLEALTTALDNFGGDFYGEMEPYVNIDQWLDYWAWCAAVGNFDGYPFVVNDVLIYEDPADLGRFVFAPWGTDESFNEYEYSGQTWNVVSGRLGSACLADQLCVTDLKERIAVAVDAYADMDVLGLAQQVWDLSEADVQTDPVRPYTPDYVWYYRDYYEAVIPGYDDYVRGKVGL